MDNKILIVDDEKNSADLIAKILEAEGYKTVCFNSASEALDLLAKDSIQVMFFDLQMPGMNGIELCRRVRLHNQLAWITAVTGTRALFEISECREAGFDDYLTKPIDFELVGAISREAFARLARWRGK